MCCLATTWQCFNLKSSVDFVVDNFVFNFFFVLRFRYSQSECVNAILRFVVNKYMNLSLGKYTNCMYNCALANNNYL